MPFPFAAALMGMSAAGSIGSMFAGGGAQGMGRIQRTLQAQVNAASAAQRYFQAAGDVTNPLFRQSAAMEESRLRRAISEGVMGSQLMARKARARGVYAGVRPEREDEARNLAMGKLFQQASEQAGGLAQQRLMATGQGMLGVAQGYGQAAGGATGYAQMATAESVANQMKYQRSFDILGLAGESMGGGQQLRNMFAPSGQMSSYVNQAPWAQFSGLRPATQPQFSWMR